MAKTRTFRTALGIHVGDVITTSYGTGPYRVTDILGPRYVDREPAVWVIRTWPVIDVSMVFADPDRPRTDWMGINGIRREADRWITDMGDEITVTPSDSTPMPLSMFDDPAEEPYPFQPGVDYAHNAWHCEHCGADFNAIPERGFHPAFHCDRAAICLVLMPQPTPGLQAQSSYMLGLNRFGHDLPH